MQAITDPGEFLRVKATFYCAKLRLQCAPEFCLELQARPQVDLVTSEGNEPFVVARRSTCENCEMGAAVKKKAKKKAKEENTLASASALASPKGRKRPGPTKIWTRERFLEALLEYAASRKRESGAAPVITWEEFKSAIGVNHTMLSREWGSWKDLRAAAGLAPARRGKGAGIGLYDFPRSGKVRVDFGGQLDLWEEIAEEARENGVTVPVQVVRILKGWAL